MERHLNCRRTAKLFILAISLMLLVASAVPAAAAMPDRPSSPTGILPESSPARITGSANVTSVTITPLKGDPVTLALPATQNVTAVYNSQTLVLQSLMVKMPDPVSASAASIANLVQNVGRIEGKLEISSIAVTPVTGNPVKLILPATHNYSCIYSKINLTLWVLSLKLLPPVPAPPSPPGRGVIAVRGTIQSISATALSINATTTSANTTVNLGLNNTTNFTINGNQWLPIGTSLAGLPVIAVYSANQTVVPPLASQVMVNPPQLLPVPPKPPISPPPFLPPVHRTITGNLSGWISIAPPNGTPLELKVSGVARVTYNTGNNTLEQISMILPRPLPVPSIALAPAPSVIPSNQKTIAGLASGSVTLSSNTSATPLILNVSGKASAIYNSSDNTLQYYAVTLPRNPAPYLPEKPLPGFSTGGTPGAVVLPAPGKITGSIQANPAPMLNRANSSAARTLVPGPGIPLPAVKILPGGQKVIKGNTSSNVTIIPAGGKALLLTANGPGMALYSSDNFSLDQLTIIKPPSVPLSIATALSQNNTSPIKSIKGAVTGSIKVAPPSGNPVNLSVNGEAVATYFSSNNTLIQLTVVKKPFPVPPPQKSRINGNIQTITQNQISINTGGNSGNSTFNLVLNNKTRFAIHGNVWLPVGTSLSGLPVTAFYTSNPTNTLPVAVEVNINIPFRPGISGGPPVITTTSVRSGKVGLAHQVNLSASGGIPPYTWSATGLPPGLKINTAGVIEGVPSQSGEFSATVTVSDSRPPLQTSTRQFNLKVYKPGDASGDNLITMGDVTLVEMMILGLDQSNPGADVDDDGQVNMGDIVRIEGMILGSK